MVDLDQNACYRAMKTRDRRFDGRFFIAVRSTGVYCRPICPAPAPKRENCLFYPCAAAAQEAGFRPCLRCRPEAAPGTAAWVGTSATVSRALRLIEEGHLDTDSVGELAERLGVGERHLRRLFLRHLGATPIAVAQTRRLLFAKKLIDETDLPMTEVALASGYQSTRRFNDAIRSTYKRAPRDLRRAKRKKTGGSDETGVELKLTYRLPFHWDSLLGFFAPRAFRHLETVHDNYYARTIEIDGTHGTFAIRHDDENGCLVARIRLSDFSRLLRVVERLRSMFDLDADPEVIYHHLSTDPRLRSAIERCRGIRIPGAWDRFELSVRAILGQQISVRAATTFGGRLVESFGDRLSISDDARDEHHLLYVFPKPEVLAEADLTSIGLTGGRAATISRFSRALIEHPKLLSAERSLDAILKELRSIHGIGEWTAQYIAMRALREPDAFPATDLGLRRSLGRTGQMATPAELSRVAERWRPWRSYAAVCLWHTDDSVPKMTLEDRR